MYITLEMNRFELDCAARIIYLIARLRSRHGKIVAKEEEAA
jgi:hypothetical protein